MTALHVRSAGADDLAAILRICSASPSAPQWTAGQFLETLTSPVGAESIRRTVLAAVLAEQVVGFAVISALCAVYPAEAELESIAVDPQTRRQGGGAALLLAGKSWAAAQNADVLRLEVRAGNGGARRLYAALGFMETGIRPGYYSHPAEDAVLMEASVRCIDERP